MYTHTHTHTCTCTRISECRSILMDAVLLKTFVSWCHLTPSNWYGPLAVVIEVVPWNVEAVTPIQFRSRALCGVENCALLLRKFRPGAALHLCYVVHRPVFELGAGQDLLCPAYHFVVMVVHPIERYLWMIERYLAPQMGAGVFGDCRRRQEGGLVLGLRTTGVSGLD